MNQKLGMDADTARAKRDTMQVQINALTEIAANLSTTYTAAQYPQMYGIETGEKTVAPWSLGSLSNARVQIQNANSAANTLLQRITTEAHAQDEASGNDPIFGDTDSAKYWYEQIKGGRSWLSNPRTLLEFPAALRMAIQQPDVWRTGLNPSNWRIGRTIDAGNDFREFTRKLQTPKWIRNAYQGASNLKFQNYFEPKFLHSTGLHSSPVGRWSDVFHLTNSSGVVKGLKVAATGSGKGFGVLGAGRGVYNIVDGVQNGDGWQIADGVVGTITSLGSLAPPPVGLVFAGVGLAYTAGRWLFGADENGKTGIDKIGDFGKATGEFLGDAGEGVGNFVKDAWPW